MPDKQKIAFFCHPYHRGGVTRWMADAAMAFAKRGLEVYFVTVDPDKEFYSAKGRETLLQLLSKESNTVTTITAKAGYEFEFGTAAYRAFVYQQLLIQLPVGTPIILSDDYVVWSAATSLHAWYPIIGVLHADEEQYYYLAEQYCRAVDVFACVSERVHSNAVQRAPEFNREHIFTIPCGISLPDVNFNETHGDILQLVFVGRVSNYQKRAGDLTKIVSLLAVKGIKFRLSVIGDGDAKTPLEQAMMADKTEQYVTFYGWLTQQEVVQHLSESDILLLTSDFEGTPIAMMEALAAGCGVVGTRVSGIEDYELHPLAEDCMKVYAVGFIGEAVDKIINLAEIPKTIRQQSARKLAEAEFSIDVGLDKYLQAIKTITLRTNTKLPEIKLSLPGLLYSKVLALARSLKTGHARH